MPTVSTQTNAVTANSSHSQQDSGRPLSGVFFSNGSTQVGMMVAMVNAASQPFAQESVQKALGYNEWDGALPLIIAAITSFFMAFYQTQFIQRTKIMESIILIPLVTAILFGMSLGANNLTASVIQDSANGEASGIEEALIESQKAHQSRFDQLQKELEVVINESRGSSEKSTVRSPASADTIKTRDISSATKSSSPITAPSGARKKFDKMNSIMQEQEKLLTEMKKFKTKLNDIQRKKQVKPRSLYKSW